MTDYEQLFAEADRRALRHFLEGLWLFAAGAAAVGYLVLDGWLAAVGYLAFVLACVVAGGLAGVAAAICVLTFDHFRWLGKRKPRASDWQGGA